MVLDEIQGFEFYRLCHRKEPEKDAENFSTKDHRPTSSSEDSLPDLIPLTCTQIQITLPSMKEIQQKYFTSMTEMQFDPSLTQELLEYHMKLKDTFPWKELFLHFKVYESQLDNFAERLPSHQLFSRDRLSKGKILYLNYRVAKYLSATSAKEQLWWLFDNQMINFDLRLPEFSWENDKSDKIRKLSMEESMEFFNRFLGNSVQVFKNCIQMVEHFKMPRKVNGTLAHYFLFQNLPSDLHRKEMPQELFLEAENILLRQCEENEIPVQRVGLHSIIRALELMSTLFVCNNTQ